MRVESCVECFYRKTLPSPWILGGVLDSGMDLQVRGSLRPEDASPRRFVPTRHRIISVFLSTKHVNFTRGTFTSTRLVAQKILRGGGSTSVPQLQRDTIAYFCIMCRWQEGYDLLQWPARYHVRLASLGIMKCQSEGPDGTRDLSLS